MKIFSSALERKVGQRFREMEKKIENSFEVIHGEISGMKDLLEAMRKYLKNFAKQEDYARKKDNKIRAEFRKDVDEFNQKVKQLRLAFDRVNRIEEEIVLKEDLARIEDGIKRDFKEEVSSLRKELEIVKKGMKGNGESSGRFLFWKKNT